MSDADPPRKRGKSMFFKKEKAEEKEKERARAEAEKEKQRSILQEKVFQEILATERTYVKNLKLVVDKFLNPLRGAFPSLVETVFLGIEQILDVNETLLRRMEDECVVCPLKRPPTGTDAEKKLDPQAAADVLIETADAFKIYCQYVNNYDRSMSTLTNCMRMEIFNNIVKKGEADPACGGLQLPSFLIMPIQRIPRYVLLIEQLLKYSKEGDSVKEILKQALLKYRELSDYINERKRESEGFQVVRRLQGALRARENLNVPQIISTQRRFVRKECVSLIGFRHVVAKKGDAVPLPVGRRVIFLFNDVIIIAMRPADLALASAAAAAGGSGSGTPSASGGERGSGNHSSLLLSPSAATTPSGSGADETVAEGETYEFEDLLELEDLRIEIVGEPGELEAGSEADKGDDEDQSGNKEEQGVEGTADAGEESSVERVPPGRARLSSMRLRGKSMVAPLSPQELSMLQNYPFEGRLSTSSMFRLVHKLDVPGAGGLLCPLFASEDKTKRDAFIEAFQSCKRLLENDKEKRRHSVRTSYVRKQGFIQKKGGQRHNWKTRWFVLTGDGFLKYYVRQGDKKELGEIDLSKYLVRHTIDPKMKKTHGVFELYCPHERAYLLYCENDGESDAWVRAIEERRARAIASMIDSMFQEKLRQQEINEEWNKISNANSIPASERHSSSGSLRTPRAASVVSRGTTAKSVIGALKRNLGRDTVDGAVEDQSTGASDAVADSARLSRSVTATTRKSATSLSLSSGTVGLAEEIPRIYGWLWKLGEKRKAWKKRWVTVSHEGTLQYFESSQHQDTHSLGVVILRDYEVKEVEDPKKGRVIEVVPVTASVDDRSYFFFTASNEDREKWKEVLSSTCAEMKEREKEDREDSGKGREAESETFEGEKDGTEDDASLRKKKQREQSVLLAERVIREVEQRLDEVKSLSGFFKERAAAEEQYAKSLEYTAQMMLSSFAAASTTSSTAFSSSLSGSSLSSSSSLLPRFRGSMSSSTSRSRNASIGGVNQRLESFPDRDSFIAFGVCVPLLSCAMPLFSQSIHYPVSWSKAAWAPNVDALHTTAASHREILSTGFSLVVADLHEVHARGTSAIKSLKTELAVTKKAIEDEASHVLKLRAQFEKLKSDAASAEVEYNRAIASGMLSTNPEALSKLSSKMSNTREKVLVHQEAFQQASTKLERDEEIFVENTTVNWMKRARDIADSLWEAAKVATKEMMDRHTKQPETMISRVEDTRRRFVAFIEGRRTSESAVQSKKTGNLETAKLERSEKSERDETSDRSDDSEESKVSVVEADQEGSREQERSQSLSRQSRGKSFKSLLSPIEEAEHHASSSGETDDERERTAKRHEEKTEKVQPRQSKNTEELSYDEGAENKENAGEVEINAVEVKTPLPVAEAVSENIGETINGERHFKKGIESLKKDEEDPELAEESTEEQKEKDEEQSPEAETQPKEGHETMKSESRVEETGLNETTKLESRVEETGLNEMMKSESAVEEELLTREDSNAVVEDEVKDHASESSKRREEKEEETTDHEQDEREPEPLPKDVTLVYRTGADYRRHRPTMDLQRPLPSIPTAKLSPLAAAANGQRQRLTVVANAKEGEEAESPKALPAVSEGDNGVEISRISSRRFTTETTKKAFEYFAASEKGTAAIGEAFEGDGEGDERRASGSRPAVATPKKDIREILKRFEQRSN